MFKYLFLIYHYKLWKISLGCCNINITQLDVRFNDICNIGIHHTRHQLRLKKIESILGLNIMIDLTSLTLKYHWIIAKCTHLITFVKFCLVFLFQGIILYKHNNFIQNYSLKFLKENFKNNFG